MTIARSAHRLPPPRRRRLSVRAGVLVTALLAAGCDRRASSAAGPPSSSPSAASSPVASSSSLAVGSVTRPGGGEPVPAAPATHDVLLVTIDSLRADMPWTGYPRPIAPWLTERAKKCALYPRTYALSSYTAKSVAPALTGKYPTEMARDGYFFTRWLPDNLFVSERAQAAGHRTLAGHGHGYFLRGMGLDQGFDDYRLLDGTFLDVKGVADVTSDRLNALAKKMLSDPENTRPGVGKHFFAYFHFLDPHYTYIKHDGHPDWGDTRRDVYDNEVHFTDKWVGDLVEWAESQPWGENLAVIITADHGEGFGERGHYRHSYEVWEALVRVPLLVCLPGMKPRRIEASRGAIDLAPTIAEILGLTPEPVFRGKSLVGEALGGTVEPRPVVVDLARSDLMDRRRAVIDGAYKIIAFGDERSWMLFDVERDFAEAHELSRKEPEVLDRMKRLYADLSADIPVVPVVGGVPLKGAPPSQRW